jgi:phage portal protein BeeE
MRPIVRLTNGRKHSSLVFGGTGGNWELPPFWTNEAVRDAEEIDASFAGYVSGAYKANGVVFACILARLLVFSEARFQFQNFVKGRPSDLFGDPSLAILERPWPNGTTGELLARMEQDGSLAGNFFATVVDDAHGRRVRRLRPDWVTIVTGSNSGSPTALDARVVGYMYEPKEGVNRPDPVLLPPDQVVHWSPIPDPDAQWRGMSWLTPIVREIKADTAATSHKLKYFEQGATGGMVIKYDASTSQTAVTKFAELWKQAHHGTENAYKTYHLGGGADVETIGADLKQLDFKVTQGAGETRVAAAAGVGAVIAQLSEGLSGSSLNSGNFNASKRRFADGTVRPLWRSAAAALESICPPPRPGVRLWYDARDVPFLKDDAKDEAEIQSQQATTIASLVREGFAADAVIAAVTSGDLRSLVGTHSGLYSVQLQPAGSGAAPNEE